MQLIGLTTVVLFLASFMNPDFVKTGGILGALFLGVAALMLAVTIRKRNKTERI
jgi:hypothetical protein